MSEYDFIVVGAGSAGCAVAGRLATESSARVLLIEAGGSDRRFTIRAPLLAATQYGTSLDWAYETDPEPGCANRRIAQPRGRVLGGCILSERGDVEALVRAVRRTREIIATEPIASTVARELVPGPDSDLEASIRMTAGSTSHPACCVAMGGHPHSPLDEKLRVRGVDNLRVADASALPTIPRANTDAPSIMIGERCADFLLSLRAVQQRGDPVAHPVRDVDAPRQKTERNT